MKCAVFCSSVNLMADLWHSSVCCITCYQSKGYPEGQFHSVVTAGKKKVVPGYKMCWFLLINCARFFKSGEWVELLPLEMRCGDRTGVGGVIVGAGQQWVGVVGAHEGPLGAAGDPAVFSWLPLWAISGRFLPWTGQLAPLPSRLSGCLPNPVVKYKLKAVFKCRGFGFAREFTVKALIVQQQFGIVSHEAFGVWEEWGFLL